MSRKSEVVKPKVDRRVQRTRNALGDAFIALIQERKFETITVQHVLDRADVGRSTFYSHYRDKNDLFLSDLEDFFELMSDSLSARGDTSNRVAPVAELFTHVAEMRPLRAALIAADKHRDVLEMGQGYFARAIERRLNKIPASNKVPSRKRTAMAQAFAGALLALMSWWLDQSSPASPKEMDDLYHQLVWSGVATQTVSMAKR